LLRSKTIVLVSSDLTLGRSW